LERAGASGAGQTMGKQGKKTAERFLSAEPSAPGATGLVPVLARCVGSAGSKQITPKAVAWVVIVE